jgi:hypothetical protein
MKKVAISSPPMTRPRRAAKPMIATGKRRIKRDPLALPAPGRPVRCARRYLKASRDRHARLIVTFV